jgi:hypothetical protein
MWVTLILPSATTFKIPACLEFVAGHVVTGLAAAFQTLTPQAIHSIKKHTKIRKNLSTRVASDPHDAASMMPARRIGRQD